SSFFKASAIAVFCGGSSCFFKYLLTSFLFALDCPAFLRFSNADSFSRCPHLQTNILLSPSPTISMRLWQFGQRAFVCIETFFLKPHSRSWHTCILPRLPFPSRSGLPQSGHILPVMLSCLNFLSLDLISATDFFENATISFMNCSFFSWPLAIFVNCVSQSAVNFGDFKSSGTSSNNWRPF